MVVAYAGITQTALALVCVCVYVWVPCPAKLNLANTPRTVVLRARLALRRPVGTLNLKT